jgi:outer membrane protein assembly complex protein YaeT
VLPLDRVERNWDVMRREAVALRVALRLAAVVALLVMGASPVSAQKVRDPRTLAAGDLISVRRIAITGTQAVSAGQLRAVIQTKRSSRLPWGRKRYFDRRTFDADLRRITAFYADRGYPQARVVSFDATLSDDQRSIALSLVVEEGPPVIIDAVRLEGLLGIRPNDLKTLNEELPVKAGDVRDKAAVDRARAMVARLLQDRGYPFSRAVAEEREGAEPNHVTLALVGLVGEAADFGSIAVAGNASVGEDIIRRELAIAPGDQFNLSGIQLSQRRLYDLDLFRLVNIEEQTSSAQGGQVPVRVTVTEAKHRQVQFRSGYGTEERLRGEAKLRHLNVFGGARSASLQGKWSSLDRGIRADFRQPFLFTPGLSLDLSAQRWFSDEPTYKLDTTGGKAILTYRLGRPQATTGRGVLSSVSLSWSYSLEEFSIDTDALADLKLREMFIALGLDPRRGVGRGLLNAIALDYRRSTAANVLDARRGTVLQAHAERGGGWLPGTYDYTEMSVEGRHYVALGRFAVLANRARAATLDGRGEEDLSVPFFKRYFLGGSNSLRGWGRFQVSPLSGSGLPIGGHSLIELSSELRFPVFGRVGMVAFADAGQVATAAWEFKTRGLRYDVGPGLRYLSPVGPLRVDLAYQVNPIPGLLVNGEPEPRRWRVHFSIGQAF